MNYQVGNNNQNTGYDNSLFGATGNAGAVPTGLNGAWSKVVRSRFWK